MELDILKIAGQIAGIGGLALGVFLILYREVIRKSIFPNLTKKQGFQLLVLIVILVWSIAVIGIGAWVYVTTKTSKSEPGPNLNPKVETKSDSSATDTSTIKPVIEKIKLESIIRSKSKPIGNAQITIKIDAQEFPTKTDGDGKFSIKIPKPKSRYHFEIVTAGFWEWDKSIEPDEPQPLPANILLESK